MRQQIFLAATLLGLASCSLAPPEAANLGPRFHEGDAANLVVRFNSWNSIQIMRPDTRENGFLPLLDRDGVVARLDRMHTDRQLAVVVLGAMFSRAQEQEIIRDWHQILNPRGFRRLVLLRAGFKDNINGLRVVYDSAINQADASSVIAPALAGIAQVASPARADAAHPSGASVR
jgi:hypothetical protein